MGAIRTAYDYVLTRLAERSSWAAISAGTVTAAVLPYPFNLLVIAFAVVQVLLPDGKVRK